MATYRIRKMWTLTVVPNHRPRLIGDQVRESFMMDHSKRFTIAAGVRSVRAYSISLNSARQLDQADPSINPISSVDRHTCVTLDQVRDQPVAPRLLWSKHKTCQPQPINRKPWFPSRWELARIRFG